MLTFIKKATGFVKRRFGPDPWPVLRRLRNTIVGASLKLPEPKYAEYKGGLKFVDRETYLAQERYYLSKHQKFEEYSKDRGNEQKSYIDLDFGVFYQTFDHKKATFECLRSFRALYPKTPVYLVSDHGVDLVDIAAHFNCHYQYAEKELGYEATDIMDWFARVADACAACKNPQWMLIMEDDIRTRDRISKYPNAHLAGQGGGAPMRRYRKQLVTSVREYVNKRFPGTEWNGFAGSGGSIFHTESFLECMRSDVAKNLHKLADALDSRMHWSMDTALAFLFMANGYTVRRWFDLSEEAEGNWGPASAFDHQYKEYYRRPWSNEDEAMLKPKTA